MDGYVEFTPSKVTGLREVYETAVSEGKEEFTFEGHQLLVAYAKYLLQYLESTQ